MKHLLQRCARRVNRDVQHEQRDGDGEHAVAECLHPALAENSARALCISVGWHDIASFAACAATGGSLTDPALPGNTRNGG
jgi:hypothetical protein